MEPRESDFLKLVLTQFHHFLGFWVGFKMSFSSDTVILNKHIDVQPQCCGFVG